MGVRDAGGGAAAVGGGWRRVMVMVMVVMRRGRERGGRGMVGCFMGWRWVGLWGSGVRGCCELDGSLLFGDLGLAGRKARRGAVGAWMRCLFFFAGCGPNATECAGVAQPVSCWLGGDVIRGKKMW